MSKVWHQCLILDPCVQNQTLIIYCNKVRIERALSLVKRACSMRVYIISSVMYAFWLVLTYDLLEDRCIDDVIIKTFFNSLFYKTSRFQVAVHLFSNRSQRTSKCGKNLVCPFFVLTAFWRICDLLLNYCDDDVNILLQDTSIENQKHQCQK